jgi:hypothetical protein
VHIVDVIANAHFHLFGEKFSRKVCWSICKMGINFFMKNSMSVVKVFKKIKS